MSIEAKQIAIHAEFPGWYQDVNVDENRDRLNRRWTGVSTLAAKATYEDLESMLHVLFSVKSSSPSRDLTRIRQPFKDADDFFQISGNDRELEILCGSTLAVLMERDDDFAATAALEIMTGYLDAARSLDLPIPLPTLAERAIARIAEHHRRRPELKSNGFNDLPKLNFAKAKAKYQEQPDANGMVAALDLVSEAVTEAFKEAGKRLSASTEKIDTFIAIQDEELEMLWWIFGERSDDLNKPFKEVAAKAQPLVFAKELADATQFLPGPACVKGLLSRAGLKATKKLTIPEAVNACDVAWLSKVASSTNASFLLQPIHFAIKRKLETNDDQSWIAGWAGVCGVDENHSFSALALGELFYRERLLADFAGNQ